MLVLAAACGDRPSDEELDGWRREAVAANTAALGVASRGAAAEPGKTLTIVGQTKAGVTTIAWDELEQLGQTHVKTTSPQDPAHAGKVTDFRGVLVRDVLDKVGVADGVDELTFVSIDGSVRRSRSPTCGGFARCSRSRPTARRSSRPMAGRSSSCIRTASRPSSVALYPDRYWSFYVTHVIVGTEPAHLDVAGRALDAAALDALPQICVDRRRLKYKSYWPSDPVRLRGVRLRDALRAANVGVPAGGRVIVRGKPAIERDAKDPRRIAAADVDRCDFLLATHWSAADGSGEQPIAARLGGPITLAVPEACDAAYGDHFWMTFVEELVPAREGR